MNSRALGLRCPGSTLWCSTAEHSPLPGTWKEVFLPRSQRKTNSTKLQQHLLDGRFWFLACLKIQKRIVKAVRAYRSQHISYSIPSDFLLLCEISSPPCAPKGYRKLKALVFLTFHSISLLNKSTGLVNMCTQIFSTFPFTESVRLYSDFGKFCLMKSRRLKGRREDEESSSNYSWWVCCAHRMMNTSYSFVIEFGRADMISPEGVSCKNQLSKVLQTEWWWWRCS